MTITPTAPMMMPTGTWRSEARPTRQRTASRS